MPIGTVIAWPSATLPGGVDAGKWLVCNGQSTNGYPELATIVGGVVPDYQGYFLRGTGGNSAALGVPQGDAIRNIWGKIDASSSPDVIEAFGEIDPNYTQVTGAFEPIYSPIQAVSDGRSVGNRMTGFSFDASKIVPTANENRPLNKSVLYIIKSRN